MQQAASNFESTVQSEINKTEAYLNQAAQSAIGEKNPEEARPAEKKTEETKPA